MSDYSLTFHPESNQYSAATAVCCLPKKNVRMSAAFSLFILFTAIQTCAFTAIGELKDKLDGRWEWVMTYGGYAGEAYTPQSEQYSLILVFSKDVPQLVSDSIGYQVYRNDSLILSGITSTTLSSMQAFGPGNLIMGSLMNISDTLQLGTFISDGYSSYFIKMTTSLIRERPCARTTVPALPSSYFPHQFTLSGRTINTTRQYMLPAQVTISRQQTAVEGIRKK